MCLFPLGGGQGFNMEPQVRPSREAMEHKKRLQIVLICHIVYGILCLVAFGIQGIFEFILCAIFYCGIAQMNYCQLIIYQVICLFSFMQKFSTVGLFI